MTDSLDLVAELALRLELLRVVEKAAWRVVGNYTPDPDATNEDEYEIGAKDVEDLRAALRAAFDVTV